MDGTVVHRKLRFGPFELSIGERMLRRDGRVLPLGDRALDILIYLADRPGEVVAKQELMDHVWCEVTVEEGTLNPNFRGGLAAQPPMLIGREVTESEVRNWIRQGRFVTLLRPGGIGETTVAVADGHDADGRLIAALVHALKARR